MTSDSQEQASRRPRRILVFGGRDFADLDVVFWALDTLDQRFQARGQGRIDAIVHGACGICSCGRYGCPSLKPRPNDVLAHLRPPGVFWKDAPTIIPPALRGADALGERWAALHGRGIERHPANWHPLDASDLDPHQPLPAVDEDTRVDRSAGPRRNAQMAATRPDGAVMFPGGRGTASMKGLCDKHGVGVWDPMPAWEEHTRQQRRRAA